MAVILADDFQQWATAGSDVIKAAGLYPQYLAAQTTALYQNEMSCFGIFMPSAGQGYGGANTILYTLYFDTQRGALCCVQPRSPGDTQWATASGYRRKISYTGDTLYFGAAIELGGTASPTGADFLIFGNNPDGVTFTAQDQVGQYLYGVGIDANGFYTFNGVSTTVPAYYRPATTVAYIDVIFGPDYMELWINDVMALRQTRANIPLKEFGITAGGLVKVTNTNFCIWTHSVIVADNSGGFGQRIGRKRAKTEQVQSVPVSESAMIPAGGYTPLAIIRKFATGPTDETNVTMIGSLVSPNPYVRNEFGVVRASDRLKPYGAMLSFQSKRLSPSGDGLSLLPYSIINGTKVLGNMVRPTSTWKQYYVDVPIASGQTFTAATFGYQHDYKDLNKVYVDDRSKVEVYGENTTDLTTEKPWYKSTDLIAFDSTLYNQSGFADFNGKAITPLSSNGNLPFKASEAFKYGQGINMNSTGALFTPLTGATLANPFTLDFWFKESVNSAISALLAIYTNTTNPAGFMQLHPHNVQTTKIALYNNNANASVISNLTLVSSTSWRHLAIVYDGTKISIYVDGTLLGSITWTILSFAPVWGVVARNYWINDTTSRVTIERYRVRAGVAWAQNFDVNNIYN